MKEQINVEIEAILRETELRLQYFAGKRAADSEEYFRFKPCEKDRAMLRILLEEAASNVLIALGRAASGLEIQADAIGFRLNLAKAPDAIAQEGIATALRIILVEELMRLWLHLAGVEVSRLELGGVEKIPGQLREFLRGGLIVIVEISPLFDIVGA